MSDGTPTSRLIENLYRERDAERALADDAAVMFTNLDNDDAVAMSDIEQWLARYQEARQR
jgi:hypothetical protein